MGRRWCTVTILSGRQWPAIGLTAKRLGNREGNFIRRSENINLYVVSKAVDSVVNMPPKLAVMMEK